MLMTVSGEVSILHADSASVQSGPQGSGWPNGGRWPKTDGFCGEFLIWRCGGFLKMVDFSKMRDPQNMGFNTRMVLIWMIWTYLNCGSIGGSPYAQGPGEVWNLGRLYATELAKEPPKMFASGNLGNCWELKVHVQYFLIFLVVYLGRVKWSCLGSEMHFSGGVMGIVRSHSRLSEKLGGKIMSNGWLRL